MAEKLPIPCKTQNNQSVITYQVISRLVLVFMPNDSILAKLYFELRGPVGLVTAVGFESTLCPNGAHNALRFKLNLKI